MPRKKVHKICDHLCAFCQKDEEHPFLGTLLNTPEMKAHSNCIFAASGLSQDVDDGRTDNEYIEGFCITALQKELKRGRLLQCRYCHRPGATVGCVVGSCPRSFHLPCINKSGGITKFEDPFPSYCKKHAPRQDWEKWFQLNSEVPTCCICLFSILPEDTPCKRASNSHNCIKTSTTSVSSTPSSTARRRRPPLRRSCVTVSTPKCVQVPNVLSSVKRKSSFLNSTWELPDSPPKLVTNEPEKTLPIATVCRKPSVSLPDLPVWLMEYLDKLPEKSRVSAYETWQHNTVHGLCCPKAWMHRSCIAGFAITAALHFVKCPYCADKQVFIRSIIDAGIWVPDRDAAWELEPGAYAELAQGDEHGTGGQTSTHLTGTVSTAENNTRSSSQPHRSASVSSTSLVRSGYERHPIQHQNPQTQNRNLINRTKPILSLVWSSQSSDAPRRSGRTKSRRYTYQTTFESSKSPPQSVPRRGRRRMSLYQNNNGILRSHVETRLRQATLGTFLASFRLS